MGPTMFNRGEHLDIVRNHDSAQWYDIVHFDHMALLWASPKILISMERVFLDYKLTIIP